MSEETNVEETNASYLSCDINGTKYLYKLAPSSTDVTKDLALSEEQGVVDIVKGTELDNGEESISLVCLNGQVYAIRNKAIEEWDTDQSAEPGGHEKALLIAKDTESNENYIANESIVIESPYGQPEEQYEDATEEVGKEIVAEDNVNIGDFLEVVTAFKCKMCPYLSQDKMQLLDHIQKLHLNSTIDIEVSNDPDSNCSSYF